VHPLIGQENATQQEGSQPAIIFDLDGTIVDSKVGILTCLKQTLQRRGLVWKEPLDWFVGPPAYVSMPRLLPESSTAEQHEIVEEYRALYGKSGWAQAKVYPGVREMLDAFRLDGRRMFVCTAKRRDFTERMLDHFGLTHYFEAIYADSVEALSQNKSELLRLLLEERRPGTDTVMVGDRVFDVEAARTCRLRVLAVSYGYGSAEELAACAPDAILDSPGAVLRALSAS
jgi:phosphoglycolate phosphatase